MRCPRTHASTASAKLPDGMSAARAVATACDVPSFLDSVLSRLSGLALRAAGPVPGFIVHGCSSDVVCHAVGIAAIARLWQFGDGHPHVVRRMLQLHGL